MKKIIALVILVVMVIGTAACAEDAVSPEANHHSIDCTNDYHDAFMSGRKLRNDIDGVVGAVTEWCSNAAADTVTFCTDAATSVANDISDTATNIWNCARGFVDGFFG